jgi:hypothetical protein
MLQSIPEVTEYNDEEIEFEIPFYPADSKSIVSQTDSAASKSMRSSHEDRQFEVMSSMEWAVRMTILGQKGKDLPQLLSAEEESKENSISWADLELPSIRRVANKTKSDPFSKLTKRRNHFSTAVHSHLPVIYDNEFEEARSLGTDFNASDSSSEESL